MADVIEMSNARRCPHHPRHRCVDQGYSPAWYGHIYECSCGEWMLRFTDESRARAATGGPVAQLRAELGL